MNQFGIQLAGAREPIYICVAHETLASLRAWLIREPLTEVTLALHEGTCLIGRDHIVAVSGPNSPRVTELFKR